MTISEITMIDISKLFVGKINVRKLPGNIDDLARSIEELGIIEPLIVRTIGKEFEVIAGTRRLAAAKKIKLKKVSCIIYEMDDDTAIIASLTENIQRGELNDEDIVQAYLSLREKDPQKWTKKEFAKSLGKSSAWIAKSLIAYGALQKLRESGLEISMKTNPSNDERKNDVISVSHLKEIESVIRSTDIREAVPDEEDRDLKRVELMTAVRDLPRSDAVIVLDRFKKDPNRPIESIKQQYVARMSGVRIDKTYLPPSVAQKLDDIAESKHTTIEDILPEIVERGLSHDEVLSDDDVDTIESVPIRTEVPNSEQYHQQRLWNLTQLIQHTKLDILTVGFSQKTVEHLVDEFKITGVQLLLDVRKNPYSQYKSEFNKENLSNTLKIADIQYEHMGQLGVPRELRDLLYSQEISYRKFFDIYSKEILTKQSIDYILDKIDQFA
ncbi:MAG: ParB/RepB/Spo0J family partition protein [Candidatus Thorarchaeota archaeon]